mgnify:FL=1
MMEIILIIVCVCIVDFLMQTLLFFKKYSFSPLHIETFDGSNQPYHPSVIYRKSGWNGFKYWMVLTPYPMEKLPYKDRWECPCIYCSNDGLSWNVPDGFCNPLDDLVDEEISSKDFFSDPHLILRDTILECWYRISHNYNDERDTYVLRKCSDNGYVWSEREILFNPKDRNSVEKLGDMVRSPAIIYAGMYRMWYVDNKKNKGNRNLCYTSSVDGKKWENRIICNLSGKQINPWHIDVSLIDGLYYLLIYDLYDLTLWTSDNGIDFVFKQILLRPSLKYGNFYSDGLYRSVLVKTEKDYRCYFSAFDDKKTYIGLMKGKSITQMKVVSCSKQNYNFMQLCVIYLKNRKRDISKLKSKLLKR